MGAKKPGFSYRKITLATEKQLQAILLRLWSAKNPVSDLPPERIPEGDRSRVCCFSARPSPPALPVAVLFARRLTARLRPSTPA